MLKILNFYWIIGQIPKSRYYWVSVHQHQGKESEKSDEKEMDQARGQNTQPHPMQLRCSWGRKS